MRIPAPVARLPAHQRSRWLTAFPLRSRRFSNHRAIDV